MKENRYYPLRDGVSCRKPRTFAGRDHRPWQQAVSFGFWSLVRVMHLLKNTEIQKMKTKSLDPGRQLCCFSYQQRGRRSGSYNNHLVFDKEKITVTYRSNINTR